MEDNKEYQIDLDEEISFQTDIEDGDMICCIVGGHEAVQLPDIGGVH